MFPYGYLDSSILFFFFFFRLLAALGLRCCAQAFSSCSGWGLLFFVLCGFIIVVASLAAKYRLWAPLVQGLGNQRKLQLSGSGAQAQRLWGTGLVGPMAWHVECSRTRGWTSIPCTGRWILNR